MDEISKSIQDHRRVVMNNITSSLNQSKLNTLTKAITSKQAKEIGDDLNVDWDKIPLDEFTAGINHEMEHGTKDKQTNITNDDPVWTAKIALAHLKQSNDYYSDLSEMESEDVKQHKINKALEVLLIKGKKLPIGTVTNGRKKVAEGKWISVSDGKVDQHVDRYKVADLPKTTQGNIDWNKVKQEVWSDYNNMPSKYRDPELAQAVYDGLRKKYKSHEKPNMKRLGDQYGFDVRQQRSRGHIFTEFTVGIGNSDKPRFQLTQLPNGNFRLWGKKNSNEIINTKEVRPEQAYDQLRHILQQHNQKGTNT